MRPLAVVWVVLSTVGVLLHSNGVAISLDDLRFVRRKGLSRPHRILVRGRVRHESMRVAVQAAFLYIGLVSLGLLPMSRVTTGLVFIGAQVFLITNSILDRLNRKAVNAILAETEVWDGEGERRSGKDRRASNPPRRRKEDKDG